MHGHVSQLVSTRCLAFCFVFLARNRRCYGAHTDVIFCTCFFVFKRFHYCSEEPGNEPQPESLVKAALDVLGVWLLPDLVAACVKQTLTT